MKTEEDKNKVNWFDFISTMLWLSASAISFVITLLRYDVYAALGWISSSVSCLALCGASYMIKHLEHDNEELTNVVDRLIKNEKSDEESDEEPQAVQVS